ncbi:MAG: hypothetical protein ACRD3V_30310 [Vicinamibacteria bacterium]
MKAKAIRLFLPLVLAVGCGDASSPTSSSTPAAPPPPPVGRWTLEYQDADVGVGLGVILVTPSLRLTEHNGAGYHVNFIRFEVFTDAPGYLQRKEFGANDINIVGPSASGNYVRPTAGGTAVNLSGTFALTLWPGDLTELRLTISVTDDRNNAKELVVRRVGDSITALRALTKNSDQP